MSRIPVALVFLIASLAQDNLRVEVQREADDRLRHARECIETGGQFLMTDKVDWCQPRSGRFEEREWPVFVASYDRTDL